MSFLHRSITLGLALSCSMAAPRFVQAQDRGGASRLYSQGVHAYFAGRSSEAESYLSSALAIETQDPRFYYFRALALMRLGRMDEARGDMMVGADLEARQPNRYSIGMALQRVQGANRLLLEQYRRQGRADATAGRKQFRRERYPQTFDSDSQVLLQRIVIPLDRFMEPGGPRPLSVEELAERPAARPQIDTAAPRDSGAPEAAERTAAEDPFRDDPQDRMETPAAAQPAEHTGPDDRTSEEAPSAEAESMPDADDEDPFSGF